jgi:D-sedoheptulose 7-phosphate isomerase
MDLKRIDRITRTLFIRGSHADVQREKPSHSRRMSSVPTREDQRGQFLERLLTRYPDLARTVPALQKAYLLLCESFKEGGKLLICGNGGSAADCEHIVGELMKGYLNNRPVPRALAARFEAMFPDAADYLVERLQGALPAISLASQTALLTAFANDVSADMVFAQQVYGYGRPGDTLLGISTSGGSSNVIHALQVARAMGLHTIGLTGRGSVQMAALADVQISVPAEGTADIQERHLALYHTLCAMLEQAFFPQ